MRLYLKIGTIGLVLGLLTGCSKQKLDLVIDSLKNGTYTRVTLTTDELEGVTEFQVQADQLLAVLQAMKLKKTDILEERPEATLLLDKPGGQDHIALYSSALYVNEVFFALSTEQHQQLKQFIDEQVYGKDASLLKRLVLALQYGKYQNVLLLLDYMPDGTKLNMEEVKKAFSQIRKESSAVIWKKLYSIQFPNDTSNVEVIIGERFLTVESAGESESYALTEEEAGNLQLSMQEAYYAAHLNPRDFSGSEEAPTFLDSKQQKLFQDGFAMYATLDTGFLSGDYMLNFTPCRYLESDPYHHCFVRTNYEKFPDFTSFETYLLSLFTRDIVNELLEKGNYVNIDNYLYSSAGGRGSNQYYRGSTFHLIEKTDTAIQFYLVGQYSSDEDFDKIASTKKFLIQLDMTEEGWRISKFTLPF